MNGARLETSKPFETTDVLKYSRKFNDPNLQSMIKNRLGKLDNVINCLYVI